MKLYKTFDPENDLCIWVYEDLDKKVIHTIIGNHSNYNEYNHCVGECLKHNEYPIISDIKKQIVSNLIHDVYGHYDKSIQI